MRMNCENWVTDPYSIGLISYALGITIFVILLWIFPDSKSKINVKCFCSIEKGKLEDTQSVAVDPNTNREITEHDFDHSILRRLPETNQPVVNYYDEINARSNENSQCQTILQDISTALLKAVNGDTADKNVYQSFFKELMNNIKTNRRDLYESIQQEEAKHTYEKIDEVKKVKKSNANKKGSSDSEDDGTYGIYVPSLSREPWARSSSNKTSDLLGRCQKTKLSDEDRHDAKPLIISVRKKLPQRSCAQGNSATNSKVPPEPQLELWKNNNLNKSCEDML